MERNLSEVLKQNIALIPEDEAVLRRRLSAIKAEFDKEPMDFWWSITAQVLSDELKRFDWVGETRKVFTDPPLRSKDQRKG
jgi:hypothetical protein